MSVDNGECQWKEKVKQNNRIQFHCARISTTIQSDLMGCSIQILCHISCVWLERTATQRGAYQKQTNQYTMYA